MIIIDCMVYAGAIYMLINDFKKHKTELCSVLWIARTALYSLCGMCTIHISFDVDNNKGNDIKPTHK